MTDSTERHEVIGNFGSFRRIHLRPVMGVNGVFPATDALAASPVETFRFRFFVSWCSISIAHRGAWNV